MSTYIPCAGSPLSVISAADTTGFNSGNLTAAFTVNVFGTMPSIFEWYRGVIAGPSPSSLPPPAQATIYVDRRPVSFTYPVGGSVFAPPQPVLMRDGNELYFFWNLASNTAVKPVVTCWFRYDTDIQANRSYTG